MFVASIAIAIVISLSIAPPVLHSLLEVSVGVGLAYLWIRTERLVNDPVLENGTLVTDIAEERVWEVLKGAHVIAVVRVCGEAYGEGGAFSAAVAVNATLTAAPDGTYYYAGPYGHIIAGSDEVSEVFSISEG